MKTKSISLFFGLMFLAVLSLTLASAQVTTSASTIDLTNSVSSKTFTITNTNTTNSLSFTMPSSLTLTSSSGDSIVISISPSTPTIAANSTATITLSYSSLPSDLSYETLSKTFLISNNANPSENKTMTAQFTNSYCSNGAVNSSRLGLDIDYDVDGFGDDEEWYPTDNVKITVNVENNFNDDLDDITVEWCLYDVKAGECIFDDEEKSADIDEDEDRDYVIDLDIKPGELNSGNTNYKLLIKAYPDSSDYKQSNMCTESSESITIKMGDPFVALDNVEMSDSIPCGQIAQISAKAWNIGDSDEEDIYMLVYNKELGVNQRVEIGDLDSLDSKTLNFEFKIPSDATAKTYNLDLEVYDEDDDLFENDDDDESKFTFPLTVGSCEPATLPITLSAEFNSETPRAVIGNQVILDVTIKNTGTASQTLSLEISGNTGWSTLSDIDPKTLTLAAGESKTASIYLDINEDASLGNKEFKISAKSGNSISEKTIKVNLEKGFSSNAFVNNLKNNWVVYLIILVNVILIAAIIIIVVRIFRS